MKKKRLRRLRTAGLTALLAFSLLGTALPVTALASESVVVWEEDADALPQEDDTFDFEEGSTREDTEDVISEEAPASDEAFSFEEEDGAAEEESFLKDEEQPYSEEEDAISEAADEAAGSGMDFDGAEEEPVTADPSDESAEIPDEDVLVEESPAEEVTEPARLDESIVYADGIFEGTAPGYENGEVKVAVTIESGAITAIEVVAQEGQSNPYWGWAQDVIDEIIKTQSAEVDAVSGATYSSTAIKNGVKAALEKSAGKAATKPMPEWFAGGTGSQEDPFRIETADQLRWFAISLNGDINYKNYYLQLSADIDISGEAWVPIGESVYTFRGTFDGAGHTISGLTFGSEEEAQVFADDYREIGFFGIVGADAAIRNLNMTDVYANVISGGQVQLGAIAGATEVSSSVHPQIDNCSVTGTIRAEVTGVANTRVGGIVGYSGGAAVINSWTNVQVTTKTQGYYDQTAGIVGTNYGGLVANCCALGNVDSLTQTSALIGLLVGYNTEYGDVVNCYAVGTLTSPLAGAEAGALSGEIDEARVYNSYYGGTLIKNGTSSDIPAYDNIWGSPVMDYEGYNYTGNIVMNLAPFTSAAEVAEGLNGSFAAFPIDPAKFGLSAGSLRTWTTDGDAAVLADSYATITYVQPEQEKVPQIEQAMKDGTFYGRDQDKTTVVKITVSANAVQETEVLQGESTGSAYDAALAKAMQKAIYNDTTDYAAADPSVFAGGSGTKEDPYQVANEEQLRYIAQAINEDTNWFGTYFVQTADIALSDQEWLPIGYIIQGYYRSRYTTYASYPFKGNYDGGDHTVTGLRIGTAESVTEDPRMQSTAGFFGYTVGTVTQNYRMEIIKELNPDAAMLEVYNVHLENILINTGFTSTNYAGGLVAYALNGLALDHCSVDGSIRNTTEQGYAYTGGAVGYALRGVLITDTGAQVDVTAASETGTVYAGGFVGYDNRITVFNAYAAGNVTAVAPDNKGYAGGFSGFGGGVDFNTFAAGSVTSQNATTNIGAFTGFVAWIEADYNSYYNSDAVISAGGNVLETAPYGGGQANMTEEKNRFTARTAEELNSAAFVKELKENIASVQAAAAALQEALGDEPIVGVYYEGDGTDLNVWTTGAQTAVLTDKLYVPVQPQNITVKAAATSIAVGKTTTVTMTGNKGKKSFKSSNTAIATVTSAGKVTAKKVGTVKITATAAATDDYTAASRTVTIKVVPAATASLTAANQATGIKLTWKKVTGATGYKVYRGSTLIKTIKSGSTVTCTDTKANTNGTKYTFKVVPTASTGNGTAKTRTTYRIARPKVSSATNSASKKMTVKWGKNAKATGYQIQYSTSKTFASGNKTATISKAATVSRVISGLTRGKTYYVRVRTFKKVGSTKYYSTWSAAKSVKINK